MDKRKSILNVSVSVGSKLITMVMVILVKRMLIQTCGNEVNGLNALYLSIIGFLSVAELGVGTAITFCMYKPIVNGDQNKVSALYFLFRKLYLIIGGVILVSGVAITPLMPYFARDYAQFDIDFYSTFLLMLVSVVLTFVFGAKTALINAYKNNYITTAISSGGTLLQYLLQILVLLLTKSFHLYLLCRSITALVQWLATEIAAKRRYASIISNRQKLDVQQKQELTKHIKAMFMHNIGMVLVNTVDGIVISAFVGIVALGEYSNYTAILTSMTGVLKLLFTSLTSVVGHLYVSHNKETSRRYCEAFHIINFMVATVFFLGYYAIADTLIAMLFDEELIIARSVSFCITLNGFVQYMRYSILLFREATGTFYYDRWKPLLEGLTNVILSILLVKWFSISGIIIATIATNLLICHVIEPYVLYKNAFLYSPKRYYVQNYSMILLFAGAMVVMSILRYDAGYTFVSFLSNGAISLCISIVACGMVVLVRKELCKSMISMFKRR